MLEFIAVFSYEKRLFCALQGLGFMFATGVGFNVSQSKALLHYTIAALGDNTWAQMALGYRYWSGISLANSCEKALEYYRKVATKVSAFKTQQQQHNTLHLNLCFCVRFCIQI